MQLPIISNLRELDNAPRRFLLFIAFNVVSWQCIVGPALVLFARKIEMPPTWVGFLISLMPISTLLVVFVAPLITRVGPKRIMLSAWFLRNLLACSVFLTPLAIRYGSLRWGWYILATSTLSFCLMRALGSGGWLPWLHEVVPNGQRGVYFSTEAAITQLLNVLIMLGQACALRSAKTLTPFLAIYAVGIASGLVSLLWMWRVPGGEGKPVENAVKETYKTYGVALKDKPFLLFVLTAALCFSSTSWLGSASVMYMRDSLRLSPRIIMELNSAASLGVLLTIRAWGRYAEHNGSGRAMFKSLTGHALAALMFLLAEPTAPYRLPILATAMVLSGIFGSAFWTATHRAMLGYMPEEHRVGYSNIWTAGTALALGLTPILAGATIQHFGGLGFQICFLVSGIAGIVCAIACRYVVRDNADSPWGLRDILNPVLPVRTLARIAWITLGLDESNRDNNLVNQNNQRIASN